MRIPHYLSYSSLRLFEHDLEEFYLRYLADKAAPRMPQERPAAAGASFDAYIKSAICSDLFGVRPQFEFQTIFESQVESQNRDFGVEAGKYIFDCYNRCGAYANLLSLLRKSVDEPRMEFTVEGNINGVPFTGKPDLQFILDCGEGRIDCVYDFKVKGFCSKYATSPSKGYMLCRNCYTGKQSKSHGSEHPNYLAYNHRGLTINTSFMEVCHEEYADQLSLYGWLLGEKIGDDSVVLGIEEIVAKPSKTSEPPQLRVANHRARVSHDYQLALEKRVVNAWDRIATGYIFTDLSKEESDAQCRLLDDVAANLEPDDWFTKVTRNSFKH